MSEQIASAATASPLHLQAIRDECYEKAGESRYPWVSGIASSVVGAAAGSLAVLGHWPVAVALAAIWFLGIIWRFSDSSADASRRRRRARIYADNRVCEWCHSARHVKRDCLDYLATYGPAQRLWAHLGGMPR